MSKRDDRSNKNKKKLTKKEKKAQSHFKTVRVSKGKDSFPDKNNKNK